MGAERGGPTRPSTRALLADALLAAAVALVVVVGSTRASYHQAAASAQPPLDALGYALLGTAAGSLLLRRVWPPAALAIAAGATAGYFAGGYPYGPGFLPLVITMYTLAARWPMRRSAAACGLALVLVMAGHVVSFEDEGLAGQFPLWLAAGSGLLLAPWGLGTVVGFRREAAARSRAEEARRYADEERLRIAREVHDVVGHGLSVINMQAGVALHVLERRPEQARPALEAIKTASKESLDELRGTLAVFRQPEGTRNGDAPTHPLPGLAQLEDLVAAMTGGGLSVDLAVEGERNHLPAAADLAAYRIVQESLTNAARHAGPATATVRVSYEHGAVALEITDDGQGRSTVAPDPGGHGIAGMRERAAALGGTLEAGPRAGGGFRVHARLPAGELES